MDVVPSFRQDGKLTIITGGSGGLANPIAKALLANGSEIALIDMNLQRTQDAALEIADWGTEYFKQTGFSGVVPKVSAWVCDISDFSSVESCFAEIAESHGKLATNLVNTAGYCENFPAEDYPAANAEKLIKVNLLGSLYVAQALAKPLIKQGLTGSLVLIGSMSGSVVNNPQPQVAYNASKAGVIHMVKSLAAEWAKYNIRVNTLSPGYILTPLTKNVISGDVAMKNSWESQVPMKRLAEPKEFVGSILYLLSESGSSYTTGHDLIVDGGYTLW
ncbi:unnamed protein product [Kuraishia capsulata CBS 1993]|uniref:D-arabinitol 2-dehydrogenase [ribulose-forming] n=1 Tax=Kuraishia capsulata CBS 1993 TaxID=1382522 RepID=W6MJ30_9ASCO|nr:uncharacterized protein KUCA_T00001934001 [Kuraishia capsulata CBS 1993]CDK25963.1 unnamed protein product [Kuraishia capsulata CBS 1993]